MKVNEIREIAKNRNMTQLPKTKSMLIQAIQRHEGNIDCYATGASNQCGQEGCLWRKDCLDSDEFEANNRE